MYKTSIFLFYTCINYAKYAFVKSITGLTDIPLKLTLLYPISPLNFFCTSEFSLPSPSPCDLKFSSCFFSRTKYLTAESEIKKGEAGHPKDKNRNEKV